MIYSRLFHMKRTLILIICIGIQFPSLSQVVLKEPLSSRQTGYNIDARLDAGTKIVHGAMKAFWVNMSRDRVPDVQMHLYLNAFRNKRSTFMKGRDNMFAGNSRDSGYIEIESITDDTGRDLSAYIRYISPDDGNPHDKSVIAINLPAPCNPGDTVWLNINFRSKLPGRIIRTGYAGNYFFVAQWFPKFGVYETPGMRYATKGGWNCHQFHSHSEFYSNHSVYDVKITVPVNYIVGSGGMLLDESVNPDSTRTLTFRAEDIVDFAWTAWPGFSVFNDEWEHVSITFLVPPERRDQVQRQLAAVKYALGYLRDRVGQYPWPHLTFVDPPVMGAGSGGMEYTTLFTTVSSYGIPEYIRLPQMVTIHEFGHAYFMGILASNESEEPWLDEGVNTYWESRIVDEAYGINSGLIDHPLLKLSDISYIRMNYVTSGSRQATSNAEYSWNYPHGTYSMMSYHKAALILSTLEGLIGEKMIDDIFRAYYDRWAFRHPSGKDFIDVANDIFKQDAGSDTSLNWFFDQTLYGTEICDYKVSDLRYVETENTDSLFMSVVELERVGGLTFPVDVVVHFENGDEITEKWDGLNRTKDYSYSGKHKIEWVRIDPEFKIRMDVDYINNSFTLKANSIPLKRIHLKLMSFIQFFISLIFF